MSLHPYMTFTVARGGARHTLKAYGCVERPAGIGPASRAWEARVLPLYDGRVETNDARPTRLLGELAFGVPLEHFETWALADPAGPSSMAEHSFPIGKLMFCH